MSTNDILTTSSSASWAPLSFSLRLNRHQKHYCQSEILLIKVIAFPEKAAEQLKQEISVKYVFLQVWNSWGSMFSNLFLG